MRSCVTTLKLVGIAALAAQFAWSAHVQAQSAADKATARQLATEAIQLYRQDRFREAFDKMDRAETLYDAPVHLLYIARCQAKLMKLVEAAEVYRRLVRVELPAQAPQTFRDAVSDGQKELAELEPTIPAMRLEVVPSDLQELRIQIDDEAVSTAILGANRPINPGVHSVRVQAAGRAPVQQQVRVELGGKQAVRLDLGRTETAAGTSSSGPTNSVAAASNLANAAGKETAPSPQTAGSGGEGKPDKLGKSPVKLLLGVEVGGAVATGKLDKRTAADVVMGSADDRALAGRFGPGFMAELSAGVSIPLAQFRVAPIAFFDFHTHQPGALFNKSVGESFGLPDTTKSSVLETVPTSTAFGLAVRVDTAPTERFKLGAFGELGFVRQAFSTAVTWTQGAAVCKFTEQYTGNAVRLAGGALLPVSSSFTLESRLGWTVGSFDKSSLTPGCPAGNLPEAKSAGIASDKQAIHSVISLGIGGTFGISL